MLKHSARVRETLGRLRTRIVGRHTETIESLMLESFRSLLRKTDLVRDLRVDPATFSPTLTGNDGKPLPFDRLSTGERHLRAHRDSHRLRRQGESSPGESGCLWSLNNAYRQQH
jgi:DNA sulfur modification protein DndD